MKIRSIALTLLASAAALTSVASEKKTEAFNVNFVVGSTQLLPSFSNNREVLQSLDEFLREAQNSGEYRVVDITYCGYASPEGPTALNDRLSKGRCRSLANYVETRAQFPDATITEGAQMDIWPEVVRRLQELNYPKTQEVIDILNDDSREWDRNNPYAARVQKLRRLDKGRVWKYINTNVLMPMRNATVTFVTVEKVEPSPVVIEQPEKPFIEEPVEVVTEEIVEEVVQEEKEWRPHLYLKTNAVAWAMLISNAAVEWEFHPHWSVTAPIYYSGVNYFTRKIKFRTLAFQPEIRYWFRNNNDDGFFVGAHFSVAKYNFAINGKYRFQDHHAKYPALGGGLSVGYRIPISKDHRWKLEFTAGGGYYHLWTDYFLNENNGPKIYKKKKNQFLVDNVGVTFMYMFDLNRGGK